MNFWSQFEPTACYPDKCQCEYVRDAFIRQPSSFWSSWGYVIAGIAIYKHIKDKTLELKLWTAVCCLMGFSSLFGHMSFINVSLAIDFASIILVLSFFALLNLFLMLKQSVGKILVYFLVYYGFLYFAMYSMGKWAKIGTCLLIFLFSVGDIVREMGLKFFKARTLQLSLFVLFISFAMFLIDEFHVVCDPHSLFQFHSLWHLGTALAMYYYGKWRFEEIRAR